MMKRNILMGMAICWSGISHAQSLSQGTLADDFDAFVKEVTADFESFRQQCMEEFQDAVRNPWKMFESTPPVPVPKEEPQPPVVMPEEDREKPHEDKPIVIEEVVKPQPVEPQPQPVEPIREVPVVQPAVVEFTLFGTDMKVRFDKKDVVRLKGVKEADVADALGRFTSDAYDNMLVDCLAQRERLQLSDWAYLQMLKTVAYQVAGEGSNEAALLLAYLYVQSGYKMRFATDGSKLYFLYASKHYMYGKESFGIDGDIYYGVEELPDRLHICEAGFPKEQGLSLFVTREQRFADSESPVREIYSKRYPDMVTKVSVNRNLIDFYNTYPKSMVDDNFMTRWAMYANTPMQSAALKQIRSTLGKAIAGKSQYEAAQRLLNWVQTGFVYEYDDKVWGEDRAFFAEESLYYPYCDCEDRSILFTRLVRDLMGLRCVLVYYPGHLASAVCFTDGSEGGDYIMLEGKRYTIADGTYIGAPVGRTMDGMDNKTATVILLQD